MDKTDFAAEFIVMIANPVLQFLYALPPSDFERALRFASRDYTVPLETKVKLVEMLRGAESMEYPATTGYS